MSDYFHFQHKILKKPNLFHPMEGKMTKTSQIINKPRTRSVLHGLGGRIRPFLMALVLVCSLVGISYSSVAAAGTTYFVDKTNLSCSDSGSGTSLAPFCTLGKAASVAGPGDTVSVVAGSYAETVNPSTSGASGNVITYTAAAGVTVTGNGTATGSAFRLNGISYITINGFHIGPTAETGIYVSGLNANVIVSNNVISATTSHGIFVTDASQVTISGNTISGSGTGVNGGSGIYLKNVTASTVSGNSSGTNKTDGVRLNASTGNTVRNNTTFGNNAVSTSDGNGIALLLGSNSNTILHNIVYGNRDSGIQVEGVSSNMIAGNLSYDNGDHGVDVTGTSLTNDLVGNTFQGNFTSGINLEGGSTGNTVVNNVLVDNGLAPTGGRKPYNIYVDSTSLTSTVLDYNLYWINSGTFQINWNGTGYNSVSAFHTAVPAQELNGKQGNPLFIAPHGAATDLAVCGNRRLSSGRWISSDRRCQFCGRKLAVHRP